MPRRMAAFAGAAICGKRTGTVSLKSSNASELGSKAPYFQLPDVDGNLVSLADYEDRKGFLMVFMCNHCPYVKHIRYALAEFARRNASSHFAMVGINANDAAAYPADSPEKMIEEARTAGYTFPYLYDESQEVARAYGAVCTPDFFLYDENRRLVYRGQFDDSRPGQAADVTGKDLQTAVAALLKGDPPIEHQTPSVGCSIKWKPGHQPS
jgi:peroxiredoxin